jgi:queuosine precursor transporter
MVHNVIEAMNAWPPEIMWVVTLFICFSSIILLFKFFGKSGLYIYIIIAIIAANIQALKIVQFSVFPAPVALGTILFTSTFLCTDILYEFYGTKDAQRGVIYGFIGYLLFTIFMIITLGFQPATHIDLTWASENQNHMSHLFEISPSLFIAGMISYFISQYHDIWLYNLLYKATNGKFLWLRNNLSTILSSLIDSCIFSFLAWYVFAPEPVSLKTLISTYILGTFAIRIIVAFCDTPILYLAKHIQPKQNHEPLSKF